MVNINSIVDFSNHPIDDLQYIYKCNSYIKENSILVLENFLLNISLNKILNEAKLLEKEAFYCQQKHTILLKKQSSDYDQEDPLNILMTSDKGCVPHDLIKKNSDLNILYQSDIFKNFIIKVLDLEKFIHMLINYLQLI